MPPTNRIPLLLCLASACAGGDPKPHADDDRDTIDPEPEPVLVRIAGEVPGAGFGAAVASSALGAWASAPHGETARVFVLDPESGASLRFASSGRAGLALATDHTGALLVGAPLLDDGAVLDEDGGTLLAGGGVGRGVAAGPIALDDAGWTDGAGGGSALDARATSIAAAGGVVGLGFAHGPASAQLGDLVVTRTHPSEGFSLAAGDLDGDGVPEWAVGAPQAGVVRVLSTSGEPVAELRGEGRFGASLAMADIDGDGRSELLVGAPRTGGDSGEAILYSSALVETRRIRGEAGDRLGTAVALGGGGVLVGAPGGPGMTGAVVWQRD